MVVSRLRGIDMLFVCRTHAYGWESEEAMEDARKEVADLIGADPKEIVFTSGATESNNISVKGVAR